MQDLTSPQRCTAITDLIIATADASDFSKVPGKRQLITLNIVSDGQDLLRVTTSAPDVTDPKDYKRPKFQCSDNGRRVESRSKYHQKITTDVRKQHP